MTFHQVWYFMLQYLATVQARNMSIVDCLNFLFQLSFASLGKVSTIVVDDTLPDKKAAEVILFFNLQWPML
jgi:hypothetical protein